MLYILVSFVPWIVYWVLCGMGNMLGIVVSLAISLLLVIPQIRKKDFNLMDFTSVLYFSIATVGTFIFNSSVFLEGSGFLGYSVLFLMALFSLTQTPHDLGIILSKSASFFQSRLSNRKIYIPVIPNIISYGRLGSCLAGRAAPEG